MTKPLFYLKHTPYPNTNFVFGKVSYSVVYSLERGVGNLDSLNRGFEWESGLDEMSIEIVDDIFATTSYYPENTYTNEYGIIKRYTEKDFYEELAKLPILLELEK